MSLGDFDLSTVIDFKFTTFRPSTGAPFTLAGTPAISVYKDNGTTQTTTGVTLTVDFDGVTGLNHVRVDTSADGTFYSSGSFFDVVITTGTVDSVSAVGSVVERFTIRKTADLKPTTAGRTLDVSSTGEAGIDWANVGSPTTSLNLSGTTISTSQAVASVTGAVGSVTGNVGGNVTGSVGSVAANGITASSIATDAVAEIQSGVALAADLATVAGYLDTEIAAIKAKTDALPTFPANFSALSITVAGGVSVAGDMFGNSLVITNLATASAVATIDDFLDTEVAAIKAVTDKLDTAMVLDGSVWQFTVNALELAPAGGGGGSTDWNADERTAIRAILGIPGSGTTPADPTTGILDTIRDRTLLLATQTSVDGKPTLSQIEASTVLAKEATLNGMRGATFDTSTDSLEAIRNRGDAAWVTGSGGGSSQAVIGSTNAITRNINEELPIQFTWNSASATITGTVEIGTASAVALQGAITFVRTDAAGKHWYQLAYDADDRPTVAGLARYVFTDGTDYLTVPVQFTEVAGGTGGGSVVVPIGGVVQTTVDGTTIKISTGTSAVTVTIATVDEDGTAVDCSALTLQVVIESLDKTDITTIANGSITKTSTTVAFAIPSSCRASEKTYRWSLRNTSNDLAIMGGSLFVTYAAGAD